MRSTVFAFLLLSARGGAAALAAGLVESAKGDAPNA